MKITKLQQKQIQDAQSLFVVQLQNIRAQQLNILKRSEKIINEVKQNQILKQMDSL